MYYITKTENKTKEYMAKDGHSWTDSKKNAKPFRKKNAEMTANRLHAFSFDKWIRFNVENEKGEEY